MTVSLSVREFSTGQNLTGFVHIDVTTQPNPQNGVQVYVDAVQVVALPNASSYTYVLDTAKIADGSHTLKAIAVYKTRKSTAQVSVTVANVAPPPPPPTPTPGPIAGLGYSLVYDEQFVNLSGWTDHIWYDPAPPAGAVTIANGNLLLTSTRANSYREIIATTFGHRVFTQGYFECRMRWTAGNGAWPAFWLFSNAHALGTTSASLLVGEIDIFEGQGSQPTWSNIALHRNTSGFFGVPDTYAPAGSNYVNRGFDLTGWHTYAALWTQTTISWYIDGAQIGSVPVFDSTNQPMFLIVNMQTGGWTVGTDSSTPDSLTTEVDWVRVWQT